MRAQISTALTRIRYFEALDVSIGGLSTRPRYTVTPFRVADGDERSSMKIFSSISYSVKRIRLRHGVGRLLGFLPTILFIVNRAQVFRTFSVIGRCGTRLIRRSLAACSSSSGLTISAGGGRTLSGY